MARWEFAADMIRQREVQVFTFSVAGKDLPPLSRVERFTEVSDGVNRKYDERHALEIAEAMLRPGTVMLDAICGDLRGDWKYVDGRLVGSDNAYLSIDDGQHRRGACEVLNEAELARWSFVVHATIGMDYEDRLRIFRQQRLRRPIDKRLDLAQRQRLDEWNSDTERQAYNLVLQLNSDPGSPLRDLIILDETLKRPYEDRYRTVGINAAGLWSTLRSVMGRKSPLAAVSLEKRCEVARNLIFAASEVWPKAWGNKDHVLTTARGVNAVLLLIVSGTNFRVKVGSDFRLESLRAALELGSKFNWTHKRHRNSSTREIAKDLDDHIGRMLQRELEETGAISA
jgi:hypothetical protein